MLILLLLVFSLLPIAHGKSQDWKNFRANPERMEERILKLSEFGKNPEGGVSRVAFSDADIQGRKYITTLMTSAGLKVRVDAAGNIIGRREGRDPKLPVILFGSHIDSVPKGGNYDGDVGVIGSLECIEILNEQKLTTLHPLEVIVFSDEEGGLVGSRAIIGDLSDDALKVVSHTGKTIHEGIIAIGGDPQRLTEAQRKPNEILAFLELHIEQGGILDSEKINIGVVEGIVGINWWDVTVIGFANHAGTTPMGQRKDALVAAAKLVDKVNYIARSIPGRQVATVGRIQAEPGAPNVIPGKVVMSLEIRDLSKEKIDQVFHEIQKSAIQIASESGTSITFSALDVTAVPAPTDKRLRKIIDDSARAIRLTTKTLPSGAGHDAQDMARLAPTGMIFVPSVAGISHSPKEFTHPKDMANGATVLLYTILYLDEKGLN
jgi:beta-ureidopropionase / N-carbamoyl-L-amino-acid hydrolase